MLTGDEVFKCGDGYTDLCILDYWRWYYSDVYNLQDTIAEYIVAKALGKEKPNNTGYWTLYDIDYKGIRIEIKETSYYHSWQTDEEKKSERRVFGIDKAYSVYQDNTSKYERQNDLYIFCLNTGYTREESDPLQLENWEFYIIPTSVINDQCGNQKTLSLSKIKKMTDKVKYNQLKEKVDYFVDMIRDDR